MEEIRIGLKKPDGMVRIREEGLQAVISARAADDDERLYKLQLIGKGDSLLLGTLIPENGALCLRRTIPVDQLRRRGLWPPAGAEVRLAYAFGRERGGGERPPQGWTREDHPARLMGERLLRECAAPLKGGLTRREGEGFVLALPWEPGGPFPMTPLFCFASAERVEGRGYAVFHFTGKGCPRLPEKPVGEKKGRLSPCSGGDCVVNWPVTARAVVTRAPVLYNNAC